ncbi:hypothetical protein Tco_0149358 [Tanacetum coccineum]
MEHDFLSQKVGGRGRGVKEKQHGSANDTTKKIVVVSSTVDELDSGNKKDTQEGNVGKTSISSTADNVHESPTTDNSASIRSGYAKLATCESSRKNVNFRSLITPLGNEVDVAISLESIRAISEWLANTTYGFFLRERVAYLIVANYIKNTLSKYGLVKSMLNSSNGLFFFQFSFNDGLDAMLQNGPWHSLDSYTFDMYMQSWGWSSYARAMIELRADGELKNTIMVVMPKLIGEGFNMGTIRVEYEWKPPRCSGSKDFGHILNECPKKIVSYVVKNLNNPRQATRCGLLQARPPIVYIIRFLRGGLNENCWRLRIDTVLFMKLVLCADP